jgi:molybdopterin molybdochelatase
MEPFTAGLISLEDAQQKMLQQLTPISDCLSVSLYEAAGRITAKPVTSPLDVPPFDNSAMDGYAVRLSDIVPDREFRSQAKLLPARRSTAIGPLAA